MKKVLVELIQDGAHGCPQLWSAHGFQRWLDLAVFRRHAMSPVAKTSHRALRAYALRKRRRVAVAEPAWASLRRPESGDGRPFAALD